MFGINNKIVNPQNVVPPKIRIIVEYDMLHQRVSVKPSIAMDGFGMSNILIAAAAQTISGLQKSAMMEIGGGNKYAINPEPEPEPENKTTLKGGDNGKESDH